MAAWLVYRQVVTPIRRLSGAVRATGADEVASTVPVCRPGGSEPPSAEDVNRLISAVDDELIVRRRAEARRERCWRWRSMR